MDSAWIPLGYLGLMAAILGSAQVEDEVFIGNKRTQSTEVGVEFEPIMSLLCLLGDVCLTYAEIKVTGLNNIPSLMRVWKEIVGFIICNFSQSEPT
jgi:hypothetical protein